MCGIVGVFQVGGRPRRLLEPGTVDAMTDAMTHRGPDDRGVVIGEGFALGARRLSIIDVERGHQPVENERGTIIAVQNGELYNHVEIRHELQATGHSFGSRCDTEVLPHLYEEVGNALPERLLGKFGLAVWDVEHRRGIVARDRLGVKPLYYAEIGDVVVVASELKAVLASGIVPLELDHDAIDAYLALGFVPGPLTPLCAVKKLLPGHRLVLDDDGPRIEQYWSFPYPTGESADWTDSEYAERLLAELEGAVASRLMSDVPLGAMLSGGLDSSLIVALMARQSSGPVKTFTVGFADTPDNELKAAREVARAFSTDHHELELSLTDSLDLDALVWSLDEPLADLSTLGFSALSSLAAGHVKVALSGQGADELLAGYGRYRQVRPIERLARLPVSLRRGAAVATRRSSSRLSRALDLSLKPDRVAASLWARTAWTSGFSARAARGHLAGRHGRALEGLIADLLPPSDVDALDRTLVLDCRLGLVDDMLHYFDRTSMAHALEVRVPFLDHRVVEFCAHVPSRLKLNDRTGKYLLRQVARGIVPDEVLDRPKVGFFSGAVDHWFRAQISGIVGDVLLDPSAHYTEFLDPDIAVKPLLAQSSRSYRDSKFLLSVLMLELWLTRYLPRAVPSGQMRGGGSR